MNGFQKDAIVLDAIKRIYFEYEADNPAYEPDPDRIIDEIYNMLSLSKDEATDYYYMAIEGETSAMSYEIEFSINGKIHKDCYVITCPGFSMEVQCSLRKVLQVIEQLGKILDDIDPKDVRETNSVGDISVA